MQTAPSRPHFLGIGAQKAGTTWLWEQLRLHPNVWMPPRKEVHYFDRHFPAPNYLGEARVLRRLFGSEAPHREWREMMRADFAESVRTRNTKAFLWYARFYLRTVDDAWYQSLFPADEGLLCGEITPAYSILPPEEVAHVARLLPELKVILLLRNPVERAWSQIRFDWTRGARTGLTDLEELKKFIDSPKQELRSSYLRMLELWGRHIPPDRLFVGFYDDVAQRPADLLARVQRFLGLEPSRRSAAELAQEVHVSRKADLPPEIRRHLAEKYLPELAALEQRLGGPVTAWLASARAAVAG